MVLLSPTAAQPFETRPTEWNLGREVQKYPQAQLTVEGQHLDLRYLQEHTSEANPLVSAAMKRPRNHWCRQSAGESKQRARQCIVIVSYALAETPYLRENEGTEIEI
jgi:hypothetical protein